MHAVTKKLNEGLLAIQEAMTLKELNQKRIDYLGKKGLITLLLKDLVKLPETERRIAGQAVNDAKHILLAAIKNRQAKLTLEQQQQQLHQECIDVTLPGRKYSSGGLHAISKMTYKIEEYFSRLGFSTATGPEIENDYYNFTALNMGTDHPARAMHDTFYFNEQYLLRTHTSTVQIRAMLHEKPPIRLVSSGKTFRCDSDATHTPMFHQFEGLMVDKNVNFSGLKGILIDFLSKIFTKNPITRFRASYFPFTEPSAEMDLLCVACNGNGCKICSNTGWLEILGCGMVDPNVLHNVEIDPEEYQGFAFGFGIDRLAMLKYGISDLRLLFENDLQFLKQF